jgi:predicted  nucleic acid-binding Zn-ribbon protein
LEEVKKNGDATLKHDIEIAENRANEYRDEMYAAKTAAKKMESSFKELKERAEGAEGQVKELRQKQPKSSSDEVNELRTKVEKVRVCEGNFTGYRC